LTHLLLFGDIESMAACNDVKCDLCDLLTMMVLEICEPPQSIDLQTQKEDIKMRVIERKISRVTSSILKYDRSTGAILQCLLQLYL